MKPTEDPDKGEKTRTDGGKPSEPDSNLNLFTRKAEASDISTYQKVVRFFDRRIYAPIMISVKDIRMQIGATILFLFVFSATFGVVLVDKPSSLSGPMLQLPFQSMKYPLGTDLMGRGLFAMLVHSSPAMLKMILAGALFSVGVGTTIGAISGYKGGWIDRVLMIITDTVLTIPALVLVIVLASFYQPKSPWIVGLILGIDNWPGLARTIRSQVLSIREEPYTEASRSLGLSKRVILRKDVVSNLMPYILINFSNSGRRIIFESVGLYYLGVLPFTALNWGVMLNKAYHTGDVTNTSQIHWLLAPMIAIILVSVGFILTSQGLDRVFNTRLRAKYERTTAEETDE